MLLVARATRRGEKIEALLGQMGQTGPWLARRLSAALGREITKQSVYQWINGGTPREDDVVPAMAKIFGVHPSLLEDDRLEIPREEPILAKRSELLTVRETRMLMGNVAIPVWSGVMCGTDEDEGFSDDEVRTERVNAYYVDGHPENHVMCIPKGPSMAPRIQRADKVIVRLDPDVPPGHLVVARSPVNVNFIKKLVRLGPGREELQSLNPDFPPITMVEDWTIRGGVVTIIHPYEPGASNIEHNDGLYLRA